MLNKKILVVDDDYGFVKIVKYRLETRNFKVSCAYSGEEALENVSQDKPDMVLLDVRMQPMDGIEVYKRLKQNPETKDIPVMFISGKVIKPGYFEKMGINPEAFLSKPYDLDEFYAAVNKTLESNRSIKLKIHKIIEDDIINDKESSLIKTIVLKGIVSQDKMEEFLEKRKKTGNSIIRDLVNQGLAEEKDILIGLSDLFNLPYIALRDAEIMLAATEKISIKYALYYKIMPIKIEEGDKVLCAISDPLRIIKVMDDMRVYLNLKLQMVLTTEDQIVEAINKFYGVGSEIVEKILLEKGLSEENLSVGEKDKEDDIARLAQDASVIRLVNQILVEAQEKNATDIHIEPYQGKLKLRYRIDGILTDIKVPPEIANFLPAMISRIKIISGLNIVERRLPQDGRARVNIKNEKFDLRVSTLPAPYGESVVIRILPTKMLFSLEKLGLYDNDLKIFESLIKKPHGIIFVTGPTGSGKTTTLYTALSKIKKENPGAKILTIEDPIEYELEGITQINVNTEINLTFAVGLRSMLRHDPDLMMVGEVRDFETAEIAIRMALTGHLLFSTLHTNDAASGITRLLDIGVEAYLVASSVQAFIAQRLVRVICENCKYELPNSQEISDQISQIRNRIGDIRDHRNEDKSGSYEDLASGRSSADRWLRAGEKCYKGKGCEMCNFTGYKGRTAIYEILLISEAIKKLIQSKVSSHEIKKQAISEGMRTLYQCGFDKVVKGIITFDEILRVTQDEI